MKISLIDRSLYFKGLLLLIRKDRKIHVEEKNMMMRIGKILDFEKTFCEKAIDEILENKYIVDSPPQFSKPDVAKFFIKDGLRLSIIDGRIDERELVWLKAVAEQHGFDSAWFQDTVKSALDQATKDVESELEAKRLEWE